MKQYSIVATTYNDEKEIKRYLECMLKQTEPPQEIVIADGGSSDNTVNIIRSFTMNSEIPIILVQKGRLNISQGYNIAIKSTSCDYVGVTGVGNIYKEDYFELLLKRIDEGNDIVYSKIRGLDGSDFSRLYNLTFLNGENGLDCGIASNHGVILKKKVFEELGYFYEDFVYAGEDTEFYLLARIKGYKIYCEPQAVVQWVTPSSMKEFKKQKKLYAIADLQIMSRRRIVIKLCRNLFPYLCLMCGGILGRFFFACMFVVVLFISQSVFKHRTIRSNTLYHYGNFLLVMEYIINMKYLSFKYHVKR